MPLWIDSLDFARNGRELRGAVLVADMPRLQEMLATTEGELNYVVRGFLGRHNEDRHGKPMLEVALDGLCQLRCQRCLQSLSYPVQLISSLLLLEADELDESSVEEDAIDSIPADAHLNVLDLLEEELLLSLPFAPRHPVGVCQPALAGYVVEETDQVVKTPFAVLAELKSK